MINFNFTSLIQRYMKDPPTSLQIVSYSSRVRPKLFCYYCFKISLELTSTPTTIHSPQQNATIPNNPIEVNEFQTIVESIHADMNRMAMNTEHEKLKAIGLRIQLEQCQRKETLGAKSV